MTEKNPQRAWWATLFFAAAVVAAVLHRLRFGVDFVDESYFAEMAHRFAHGARPFVDELSLQQFEAWLVSPLVRVYEAAVGGHLGLVLFLRYVYVGAAALAAWGVYRGARDYVSREFAVLLALGCVAYVPFNIASPSYDSIAYLALTAGCFLAVARDSRGALVGAGLCHALAVSVYPTLLVVPLVMAAVRFRRDTLVPYLGGLLVGLVPAMAVVLWIGLSSIHQVATLGFRAGYSHLSGVGGASQHIVFLTTYGAELLRHTSGWLWAYLLLVLVLARFRPAGARWAVCLLPAVLDASVPFNNFTSTPLVIYPGLLLPMGLLLVRNKPAAVDLFRHIGIPSLVGGAVVGYTSYNGLDKAAVGLFPACLLTGMFLAWYMAEGAGAVRRFAAVPQALMVVLFLILLYGRPYNDDPIPMLTAAVQTGGYAGLYTTPARESFLSSLAADLNGPGSVMFYNDFPGGYLLTPLRCDSAMVWIFEQADRDALLHYYDGHRPDVVVRMKRVPRMLYAVVAYQEADKLDQWLKSYQQVVSTPDYDIYRLTTR